MRNLEGRKILVTGGGSGIGRGAAKLFVDWGAEVFLADIGFANVGEICRETGARGAVVGDLTSETQCDLAAAAAREACDGLDGLFHSAGVSDQVAPALEADLEKWQSVVNANLRATFLMCRAVGRILLDQQRGAIVNISSVNGLGGIPRRHAYGPAKAAIAMLTRNLACEWGASGVRVNAIAPAYINTPMVDRLVTEGKIDRPRLVARTPLARLGDVEEVAAAAAFLLSDAASYITGAILPVDGGWTAYGGPGDVLTA